MAVDAADVKPTAELVRATERRCARCKTIVVHVGHFAEHSNRQPGRVPVGAAETVDVPRPETRSIGVAPLRLVRIHGAAVDAGTGPLIDVDVIVDETVILLHHPLPLVGVSIVMERELRQNDTREVNKLPDSRAMPDPWKCPDVTILLRATPPGCALSAKPIQPPPGLAAICRITGWN